MIDKFDIELPIIKNDGNIIIKINKTIYSKDVILITTAKFVDVCPLIVDEMDELYFIVQLDLNKYQEDRDDMLKQFCQLLSQENIREYIKRETEGIKDKIIERAFR